MIKSATINSPGPRLSFRRVNLRSQVPFVTSASKRTSGRLRSRLRGMLHDSVLARAAQRLGVYPRPVTVLEVQLRTPQATGFGEAVPRPRYGETLESAAAFLEQARRLLAEGPADGAAFERGLAGLKDEQMAAKAALDAALLDLQGKLIGQPIWRMLALKRAGPATSYTLSLADPDAMSRCAARARLRFRRLKLKLGGKDGLDAERVRAVRAVTHLPISVDVNEGWTLDEALDTIPRLARLGVDMVEQPLPAGDRAASRLKAASALPIFLDEDCRTLADLPGCAERGHGVNVKLAKCGGPREAVRMARAARSLGLSVMIGCMLESSLGIAAAAQVASLFDRADLDGNLLLADDPWQGLDLVEGVQLPADRPGLGVQRAVGRP